MSELTDTVVLITGAASGLGKATALAAAEAGAVVVCADVDVEGGEAVAAQVGGRFVATDVSDLDANRAMVDFAVSEGGGLDHAFLNAGVASQIGVGDDFDLERYRRVMGINLDGVVFGVHTVLPALRARGGGSIVATASLAGLLSMPLDPLYGANKHAVVGLARAVGDAVAHEGIRMNAICPGFSESNIIAGVREDLIAAGFEIIPAEKVAGAVLQLFGGDMTGEAWVIQAGRDPLPYAFRRVPGPR